MSVECEPVPQVWSLFVLHGEEIESLVSLQAIDRAALQRVLGAWVLEFVDCVRSDRFSSALWQLQGCARPSAGLFQKPDTSLRIELRAVPGFLLTQNPNTETISNSCGCLYLRGHIGSHSMIFTLEVKRCQQLSVATWPLGKQLHETAILF